MKDHRCLKRPGTGAGWFFPVPQKPFLAKMGSCSFGKKQSAMPGHFFRSGTNPITSLLNFFRPCKKPFWPKCLLPPRKKTIGDARALFPLWKKPNSVDVELFPFRQGPILAKNASVRSGKKRIARLEGFSGFGKKPMASFRTPSRRACRIS